MQKRMHHEVMIDAQTLYSVVKAAYPEVTHPQLVVTESDVSYRLCDGYITPNLDLRLRGQCGGGAVDLSLVDGNAWERLDSEVFVESLLDYLIKKGHLTPEQYTFLDVTPEMADWKDQVLPERPDLYVLSVSVPDINQATWLTMVVGLKKEEQNPAVPVVLLCEALATKEQAIDHALRILEEHFAYHELYRFRDPEALQQEVRNALDTDAVYTPYVLLNSTWKDYSPLSVVLRKVEIPPVGSLGY